MSNVSLSPEVWLIIFEYVAHSWSSGPKFPLSSVLLVCKAWKIIASPLLPRFMYISSHKQLERSAKHVLQQHLDGTGIGQSIQLLDDRTSTDMDHLDAAPLMLILAHCTNLQSFSSYYLSLYALDVLSTTCAKTLEVLDIELVLDGVSDHLFLGAISRLKTLRCFRLYIFGSGDGEQASDLIRSVTPWQFTRLEDLTLGTCTRGGPSRNRAYMEFLCLGRFPRLNRLELILIDKAISPLLKVLLEQGGDHARITHLRLLEVDTHILVLLHESLDLLQHLDLDYCQDWAALIPYMPSSLQHLSLEFGAATTQQFTTLVDAITRSKCPCRLETIQLIPHFRWRWILENIERKGEWIEVAKLLKGVGVNLLDRNEEDVFTVASVLGQTYLVEGQA